MNLQRPPHQLVATVLGAGTMGAQIAAHLANAGVRTHLLDIVPRGVSADAPAHKRSAIALGALKIMAKARPAPFMDGAFADRIRAGNLEDDIERAVGESDLVIEAVVERLDIKQQLFTKVAAAAKPGAILASNTSGISIGAIAEGLPEDVRPRVVGMHFFNPPRYMYLLEVVPSRFTAPEVTVALANFSDHVLGKGVVICRDTPNFIGNRIGIAEMLLSFHATKQLGLTVEEVDLLNGPLVGRPKTASYRLGDVVGLDVVGHVIRNMRDALSGDPEAANYDEMHAAIEVPAVLEALLSSGRLGDKTGAGFYKKTRDAKGNRVILSLDLDTLEYREAMRPVFPELAEVAKIKDVRARVHAALRVEGRAGEFLRLVYLPLLNYAANRVGEICDDARQIDQAIRWGYAWQLGPFELFDAIGPGFVVEQIARSGGEPAKAAQELVMRGGANARWYGGRPSAPTLFIPDSDLGMRPIDATAGVIDLAALRDAGETITGNASASLVDIGDGIACLEFHVPKMNILDEGVTALLASALTHVEERGLRGLVIGTAADNFCAGADLRKILRWAEDKDFEGIEAGVAALQATVMNLQHASVPVVAAARGMTLAGGLEVCLHCASIQAAAESYMGLVEVGVGLIPAGGGLKELCRRASAWASQVPGGDPYPFIRRAFDVVGGGKVSSGAHEGRAFGYLAPGDGITFNKQRVLADAKRKAIALSEAGWVPPDRNAPIQVIGAPQGTSFLLGVKLFGWGGYISEHDALIGKKLTHVLSGGMPLTPRAVTAQHLLDLEREAFVSLTGEPKTVARIKHMLEKGKPLRN